MADIDTGRMPRIPLLTYEETEGKVREMWEAASRRVVPGLPANESVHPQTRTLLRHPELVKRFSPFTMYLMQSTCLPVRHRELAILRTAWHTGSDTQWYAHELIGLECGLTQDEIDRVPLGPDADGWAPEEAALLRACDELRADCRLGDATWDTLRAVYDERQMIEFLILVGNYTTLSFLQGSVGIKPFDGASPDIPGNRFLFTDE